MLGKWVLSAGQPAIWGAGLRKLWLQGCCGGGVLGWGVGENEAWHAHLESKTKLQARPAPQQELLRVDLFYSVSESAGYVLPGGDEEQQ